MIEDRVISIKEAQSYLNCGSDKITKMCLNGEIVSRLRGNKRDIYLSSVQEWIAKDRAEAEKEIAENGVKKRWVG